MSDLQPVQSELPSVIPDFAPAEPQVNSVPLAGSKVKFLRDNGEGELLELEATVFENEMGEISLQVVNENNEIEWHFNPVQGVGDGEWQ